MPHDALDYTYRMLDAVIDGAQTRQTASLALAIAQAHQTEAFARSKRLPPLDQVLRKLYPARVMSPREQHRAIMGMAKAMGAAVVFRKRGEA